MSPSIIRVIPILRIFSVDKAKEFYLDFLGFQLDWEHRLEDNAPLYMQISLGDLVLHLSEHYGDAIPGAAVRLEVEGLGGYHAGLTAKNYRYFRPGLEQTPWGAQAVCLLDPFGNHLNFEESQKPDPAGAASPARP